MTESRPRWTWALAGVLAVAGLLAITVRPHAPSVPVLPLARELATFPSEVLRQVEAWVAPIRVAFVLRTMATLGVPLLLVSTIRGRRAIDRLGSGRLPTLRGALVPQLAAVLVALPFVWWIGWDHAGDFGFRTAGPVRFVLETAGAFALELAITTVTVMLLLWLVRRRPDDWPAVGTLLGTVLTGLLVLVQPLVVTALLYDPQPLEDPAVRATVEPVVERSVLPGTELLVGRASVRTTRVNALVTGIGPTQQVVLWDTLLELPPERIAAVVGHELAHAEHADLPRGVLASAAGILVVLGLAHLVLRRAGEVPLRGPRAGAVAAVALVVAQFVATPVVAWQSRRVEAAADARALELVGDPAGQVALQRGFVVDDLSDPTPPTWVRILGSHPTPTQRIQRAVAFAMTEGLDPVPAGLDPVGEG